MGELSVWALKDILVSGKLPLPIFADSVSHFSEIESIAWNPTQTSMLATGGSSEEDQVIRLFDMARLSERT